MYVKCSPTYKYPALEVYVLNVRLLLLLEGPTANSLSYSSTRLLQFYVKHHEARKICYHGCHNISNCGVIYIQINLRS